MSLLFATKSGLIRLFGGVPVSRYAIGNLKFSRYYSTPVKEEKTEEKTIDQEMDEKETEQKKSKATSPKKMKQQRPTISKVGVPFAPFIIPRWSRMPNPITSPLFFIRCWCKKFYMYCYDWVQVTRFKNTMGSGYKPNFLKWKNEAIEDYVKVNKAFADKRIENARDLMSEYVYFALGRREKELPKNVSLGWELVKFNEAPKLISFHAFPHDDGSVLLCQVLYKFNTKQKMIIKKRDSKKFDEKVKNIIEYISFNVDPFTDRVVMAGSVFESLPQRKLSQGGMPTQEETINNMIKNGDIFRPEPSDADKLTEIKKEKEKALK